MKSLMNDLYAYGDEISDNKNNNNFKKSLRRHLTFKKYGIDCMVCYMEKY